MNKQITKEEKKAISEDFKSGAYTRLDLQDKYNKSKTTIQRITNEIRKPVDRATARKLRVKRIRKEHPFDVGLPFREKIIYLRRLPLQLSISMIASVLKITDGAVRRHLVNAGKITPKSNEKRVLLKKDRLIVNSIEYKKGVRGMVFRKGSSGAWVRSTMPVSEYDRLHQKTS
jgi:hypothetical protein